MNLEALKPKIEAIIKDQSTPIDPKLSAICTELQESISYYNWVGYYFADFDTKTLHLKAYAGAPTDHIVIPFGKGICGQVALSNKNFVVPDVSAQDNYIACSITVKSEIVVPLFVQEQNIGQIDIDSHSIDPFDQKDEQFLEWVNAQVATLF